MHIAEDLQCLIVPSMLVAESWRFRKPEDKYNDDLRLLDCATGQQPKKGETHKSPNHLTRNWQPPGNLPSNKTHPVIEEVTDHDAHTNQQGFAAYQLSSLASLA